MRVFVCARTRACLCVRARVCARAYVYVCVRVHARACVLTELIQVAYVRIRLTRFGFCHTQKSRHLLFSNQVLINENL